MYTQSSRSKHHCCSGHEGGVMVGVMPVVEMMSSLGGVRLCADVVFHLRHLLAVIEIITKKYHQNN